MSSKLYRFFEILPGALAWTALALAIFFSWFQPVWVAVFIIVFDLYWLLKTLYLAIHLHLGFSKADQNLKTNWLEKLKILPLNSCFMQIRWEDIYHVVILPMYKEPYNVVKESFETIANANYPADKIIVVLATEERASPEAQETAKRIKQDFGDKFFKFLITVHPKNLPGEIAGKGSNEAWAGKEVKKTIIDPLKIPYENILVSIFDVDTQIMKDYFGVLTYNFLTAKNPLRSSYQPIPFFNNNIYQAPALARVVSFTCSSWQLMQQSRPEKLTTFSSQSIPFKALAEIGFWNTNIVSEDSNIFFQCFLHYNGDWRVIPLFYPVSMDANVGPTMKETISNLYKQQRRWAWGAENIAYLVAGFAKNKKILLKEKIKWSLDLISGSFGWSTNALLIFLLGWLPIQLGGDRFNISILSYNLPKITSFLMTFASIGIISTVIFNILTLPDKPKWFKKWHYSLYILQWFLMPINLIFFGSIPALDAQTRLMLSGKHRLDFWVTPKRRIIENP
ncbi:MAG: glycosyltransferase family 2 protein [Candidatus Paceibacterota bacterium]|jgi:cellulose synthase/poly-beta-1,6-N-acetylglucosamine synthase-like glycosyltransferase